MEEFMLKTISLQNLSTWEVKKSLYRTYQKESFLSNRLKILQLQKSKKVKNIQNTLMHHRKEMLLKIDRYKHINNINHRNQQDQTLISVSSDLNKSIRITRVQNMKKTRLKIRQNKHKEFDQEKSQHQSGDHWYKEEKDKSIQENIKKRNKIRLMELQSKTRVKQYWDRKLDLFKEQKIKDIERKLDDQKIKLIKLGKMEKIEKKLIKELKETDSLQEELNMMINQEKRLEGKDLQSIYA